MKYVPPKKITESGMHVQFTEKDGKYIVSGINRPRHPDSTQPKEIRSTRNV